MHARRKETRDVCVGQVGPANSQTPVCPPPRHLLSLSFSSSSSCPASSSPSSSTSSTTVAFLSASAHAPSSKRNVWVYTRILYAMYRRTTLLVRVYRLGFTRRGRETAGVFTISLETRRERNLEKGTFQITGKLLIPLSRASFRISCLLEIGGGVVKDLVVFDKYLQQRVSDILGFI